MINQTYDFMNEAYENCESVLVCSLRGQSRALTIITAFLMKKFSWSLYKTLEYLNSKRSDFEIRATFLRQLLQYEIRLFGTGEQQTCSKTWRDNDPNDSDGLTLRNTYVNSLLNAANYYSYPEKAINAIRSFINVDIKVKWSDEIETEIVVKDYTRNINLDSEPKKSILKLTKRTQDHAYSHQAQQLKTEF